jgi:hypothetical protein
MIQKSDIDGLKADIHADLEAFAFELFKDLTGLKGQPTTNSKGTYYIVPGLGRMSLLTGGFFVEGSPYVSQGDVIGLWMKVKERTFPEAFSEIRTWLDDVEAKVQNRKRRLLWESQEKDYRKNFGEVLFKNGEDEITDSASGILKRMGCLELTTVKGFTAQLRKWETENGKANRDGHVIVIEKPIGKLREKKGGKSKFTFIRYGSSSYLDWGSEEADRKVKEEQEQYHASLRR